MTRQATHSGVTQKSYDVQDGRVVLAVMPHHDLILDEFAQLYRRIAKNNSEVREVIVLSPNHYHTQSLQIRSSQSSSLPFVSAGEEQMFRSEHGVMIHVPFIRKHFSGAVVDSFLFTRHQTQQQLDAFVEYLVNKRLKSQTLIIASVDFSHGLAPQLAKQRDEEMMAHITAGKSSELLTLSDEYLDCPSCMYVMLKLADELTLQGPQVIYHGNSSQYVSTSAHEPTTSYYGIAWTAAASTKQ
jgi:predicted class III extradiol MEMO1 family dioxygenase